MLCRTYTSPSRACEIVIACSAGKPLTTANKITQTRMKLIKQTSRKIRSRLPAILMAAAILTLNAMPVFAQAFNSTELKTGISNSLAVIMMFGFVLGISAVIYGGFAIRRGDVDQGKMSIIGGAIIAAAPAAVFAFYKIFGIDANSSVGVGNF